MSSPCVNKPVVPTEAGKVQTVTKNNKGKPITADKQQQVYDMYMEYMREGLSKTKAIRKASVDCGISPRSLWKIINNIQETGRVVALPNKRHRKDSYEKLNPEQKTVFHTMVTDYINRGEDLTSRNMYLAIKKSGLPDISYATVNRLVAKGLFAKLRVSLELKESQEDDKGGAVNEESCDPNMDDDEESIGNQGSCDENIEQYNNSDADKENAEGGMMGNADEVEHFNDNIKGVEDQEYGVDNDKENVEKDENREHLESRLEWDIISQHLETAMEYYMNEKDILETEMDMEI